MSLSMRERNKAIAPILILGVIVVVACIYICILHVIDLTDNFRREVETNYEQHIDVASQVVEDHMNTLQQAVASAAEELHVYGNGTIIEEDIYKTLQEYQNVGNLGEITYVAQDGMTYFSDEIKFLATTGAHLRAVMSGKAFTRVSMDYKLDDSNGILTAVAPIFLEDEQVGAIVAIKSLKGMLDEKAFEFLRREGDIFLIDESGTILDQSIADASSKGTDLFRKLKNETKRCQHNDTALTSIRANISQQDYLVQKFLRTDNTYDYVLFRNINAAQGLFLVEIFPESVFTDKTQPIVYRGVFTCGMIILLMMAVIVFVWIYSRKSSEEIKKMAYADSITEGKNFNYFLDQAIYVIKDNKDVPYLMQRFDISNFRYINETYGHVKADEILKIVIEESEKVFSDRELCVRMNADQFVVLAQNTMDYSNRMMIFEDNINMRAIDIGIRFPIKLKSGIYAIRQDDYDVSIMVDRANVARKSLNTDSKDLYAYYSDKIVNDMRKIDMIESNQQSALINGEFKVYLQPKWDIYKDELYGAEALVRWIKEDGEMIYPDSFIPIFEQNGFIEQLDFFMLETVCAEIRKLLDEGRNAFPISVNQSRRLWDNPEYVENVARIIRKHDIPSHYIDLEVTETVFFGEREKMLDITSQLKEKEVLLSMDDFGSGYSSLNLLKDIPFDILKIDREFFTESITSTSSTWILKKVVEIAEGLGIHVLCEGVETLEQINLLKGLGCQYVQGYYYSKPIPIEEFIEKYVS